MFTWCGALFSLQEPFNTVTLSAIGDDSAPTFFEIGQDGRIKVKAGADLASDTETSYRVSEQSDNQMFLRNAALVWKWKSYSSPTEGLLRHVSR